VNLPQFAPVSRVRRAILGLTLATFCLTAGSTTVRGENGDLLGISTVLEGTALSDLALDTSAAGSMWVLGEQSGQIYSLSLSLGSVLRAIPNPHGPAVFPLPVLSVGLAYRPASDSLFVLAQKGPSWDVKEVNKTNGVEVRSFPVTPPDPGTALLRGLTYDANTDSLWYLDLNNDSLVRMDLNPATGNPSVVLSLPGDEPPEETELRGEGLSFELVGSNPRIYIAHGDIFTRTPSRLVQVSETGSCTGVEVPLGRIAVDRITGVELFTIGQQRRLAVIGGSESLPDKLFQLEQIVPTLPPPTHLECALTLNGQVRLSWENNGNRAGGNYGGEIQVLRNNLPLISLSGTATTYVDQVPLQGASTYALRASGFPGEELSPASFACKVTVGPGGLVRWTAFPGVEPFDVATDETNGDIFVTDPIGTSGQGSIYHFDSELHLIGEIPSPWNNPGPIAFVSHIELEIPFTDEPLVLDNVLAVAAASSSGTPQLRIIDTTGSERAPVRPLRLPEGVTLGGLTFIEPTQEFALIDSAGNRLIRLNTNGGVVSECQPNELFVSSGFEGGLGYDVVRDRFLAVFQPEGAVRELLPAADCLPLVCDGCRFALDSLGQGYDVPGFFGGVAVSRNSLIVCGRESSAIFQVFIFPSGPDFVRGDFDRSGTVQFVDALGSANYLFDTGSAPTCPDSADANDDGILDVADPVYVLFYLFVQGTAPPPPFPDAGDDPTFRDSLGCDES